ncbi:thioredoxin-dependent thiol peroxidase [Thorsellia anophelis]|uniref:thioredoxin-dependent peroxiredoxin n=1 Tax=Thorsellia anophelis DSM 18579 TaxID=1123402 RepID=A0A1I0CIB4_9GAMM|nr:thioredoxin-dependent thiol peroxidase [Thorsellia anophelis]SET19336.1 peroxiredoxin Q/BCP [Thorsellia anophelis DSM 18579]
MTKLLEVGDKAPSFALKNQKEEIVNLSDFLGRKVLVYFYPKAMTPGCTVQACSLRDTIEDFKKQDVEILGISIDPPKRLAKFIERDELNFTLLSDEDHAIAELYGVWGEKKFMGKVYDGIHRISFLIDENGHIMHVFDNFKTNNHHQVILDFLAEQNSQNA